MASFFGSGTAQGKAAEATLDALTKHAERPELVDRIAAYRRNLFKSLKKRGLTSEQALEITLVTPIPSLRRWRCREGGVPANRLAAELMLRCSQR